MSEEKPKDIRKKCEHSKYSFQCKDCKGSSLCDHEKRKYSIKSVIVLDIVSMKKSN
jgi:hypothetical protein